MQQRIFFRNGFAFIFIAFLFVLTGVISAQSGGQIDYGASVVSALTDESPLAIYTFQGSAGDSVNVQVIPLTPGLQPTVNLLSPNGQPLTTSTADMISGFPSDAILTFTLADNGRYTLLVGGATDVTGEFLLRLAATQTSESVPLTTGEPLESVVNTAGLNFLITANAELPSVLTVSGPDSVNFTVSVRDQTGALVAFSGGLPVVVIVLPPGDGIYTVNIVTSDGEGMITISLSNSLPGAPTTAVPVPAATPEADEPAVPEPATTPEVGAPDGACMVSAPGGGPVNIRPQPNTNNDPIAQLTSGQSLPVLGIYNNWYAIGLPGGVQGWVRQDVVNTTGNCGNLPTIQPPDGAAVPANTPEAGATATYTPTSTVIADQPAPTNDPGIAPTATAIAPTSTFTPTPTPTVPPPVAPADANFNSPLTIPLDSTASVTDFVSYPEGDTQDRVRWDISGMNPTSSLSGGRARLILAVSCFGTGTDQIEFFTGGQTYSCGQTIVDREVTYDSRTGQVTITAVGGQNTYVQWVLTGTATRVN